MVQEIIKCNEENLEEIWNIVKSCSEWLTEKGMTHWIDYYTKEIVDKKLIKTEVYGLSLDENLIGCVSLSKSKPAYYRATHLKNFKNQNAEAVYLSMLAILPKFHENGFASKLIDFAEEKTKNLGIGFIRLDAYKPFERLNEFYIKRNYKLVQTRILDRLGMNFYEKSLGKLKN
ncbi:MAG: GNAT family N-acetyltransferase [Nanoarchaeota archaeon]